MSPSASDPSPAIHAAEHAPSARGTPFGDALRQWRTLRRLSQLELASRAATPPRHVSFLETGRARPSEAMVQRLAEALDLPPDEHNRLLAVAGFAAAHLARPLSHAALAQVQFVVQRLLASHAPFPALVLDAHYDILDANGAARALFAALGVSIAPARDASHRERHAAPRTGADVDIDIDAPANVIALLLTTFAPLIENHRDVLLDTQRRLRRDLAHRPGDARLAGLLARVQDQLTAAPRAARSGDLPAPSTDSPVLLTRLRTPAGSLATLSALVHFGSAHDVTVEGLHVELIYPADDATAAVFAALGT